MLCRLGKAHGGVWHGLGRMHGVWCCVGWGRHVGGKWVTWAREGVWGMQEVL